MKDIDDYMRWTRSTVQYPASKEGEYVHNGLISEVGEYYGATAKFHRGDYEYDEWRKRVTKELGDVFWMLVRTCDYFDIVPSDVLKINIDKLTDRKRNNTIKGDDDPNTDKRTIN